MAHPSHPPPTPSHSRPLSGRLRRPRPPQVLPDRCHPADAVARPPGCQHADRPSAPQQSVPRARQRSARLAARRRRPAQRLDELDDAGDHRQLGEHCGDVAAAAGAAVRPRVRADVARVRGTDRADRAAGALRAEGGRHPGGGGAVLGVIAVFFGCYTFCIGQRW